MISLYEPFLYGGNINFPFFRIKRSLNGTLVHYYVQNDAKITIYFGSISPYITPFQILTVYLRYLNLFLLRVSLTPSLYYTLAAK